VTKALLCVSWALRQAADGIDRAREEHDIQLAAARGQSVMASVQQPIIEAAEERVLDERLLTLGDLAALVQVSEKTLRRWRSEGRLPSAVEIGGVVRWRREDVDAWISEHAEGTGQAGRAVQAGGSR